jgi:hypothetical protein
MAGWDLEPRKERMKAIGGGRYISQASEQTQGCGANCIVDDGMSCHNTHMCPKYAQSAFSMFIFICMLPIQPLGADRESCLIDTVRIERFSLLRRSVTQDQGAWVIDYQLRHEAERGSILTPSEVGVALEGWVSNSRILSHTIPRRARVTVSGASTSSGTGDVITSTDDAQRCCQRVGIIFWADDGPNRSRGDNELMSLAPGATFHIRMRIEHQHVLYGEYNPLLGVLNVELRIGSVICSDRVSVEEEQYLAQPRFVWVQPPEERRDPRYFISPPDSLHLEAHVPGHQYYRFPERPVRYGSKMRLCFWYLTAAGTEGECRVRVAQYKDTPTSWRVLSGGSFEQVLETVGHWTKFERTLQVECQATTIAIDFRIISDTNVGEVWIDDVSLEPLGCSLTSGKP